MGNSGCLFSRSAIPLANIDSPLSEDSILHLGSQRELRTAPSDVSHWLDKEDGFPPVIAEEDEPEFEDSLSEDGEMSRVEWYRRLWMSVMMSLVGVGTICMLVSIIKPTPVLRPDAESALVGAAALPTKPRFDFQGNRQDALAPSPAQPDQPVNGFACADNGRAWSEREQIWCCEHRGLGCSLLDCPTGNADSHTDGLQGKQEWCCRQYGRGCPSPEEK